MKKKIIPLVIDWVKMAKPKKKAEKKVSKKLSKKLQVVKTTRKKIRKIIGIADLHVLTITATKREEKRRQRVNKNKEVVNSFFVLTNS